MRLLVEQVKVCCDMYVRRWKVIIEKLGGTHIRSFSVVRSFLV